ncbi:hypothetical protein LTR95_011807 [Oleoguttula sp. CCFEE 5521]
MSALRLRALRGLARPTAARAAPRTNWTQLVARRWASSGGHGSHEASSDLPWALSAGIITPVGAYFLWPSASTHADHGHHDAHGEEHEEHAEGEEGEEKSEDAGEEKEAAEPAEDAESKEDETKGVESKDEEAKDEEPKEDAKAESAPEESSDDSEKKEDDGDDKPAKPSGSEGEAQPKTDDPNKASSGDEPASEPKTKKGESGVEGVKGKGHMKADAPGLTDTVKSEPDGKGGFKKRVDSGAQTDLGDAAAKPSGDIAKKQEGMSNTPTRHSTDIHNSSEKSTKGEGVPDTAKINGPVDPSRPAK